MLLVGAVSSGQTFTMSQDETGWTKLHFAAVRNKVEEAKKMLAEAKDLDILSEVVNKADNNGWTPLYGASYRDIMKWWSYW